MAPERKVTVKVEATMDASKLKAGAMSADDQIRALHAHFAALREQAKTAAHDFRQLDQSIAGAAKAQLAQLQMVLRGLGGVTVPKTKAAALEAIRSQVEGANENAQRTSFDAGGQAQPLPPPPPGFAVPPLPDLSARVKAAAQQGQAQAAKMTAAQIAATLRSAINITVKNSAINQGINALGGLSRAELDEVAQILDMRITPSTSATEARRLIGQNTITRRGGILRAHMSGTTPSEIKAEREKMGKAGFDDEPLLTYEQITAAAKAKAPPRPRAPRPATPAVPPVVPAVQATPPADAPEMPQDLGAFAAEVQRAAAETMTGGFGENKVLINHVFQTLRKRYRTLQLEDFKKRLVEANRAAKLDLSRADLVQVMQREDVAASEAEVRIGSIKAGEFHLLQTPANYQRAQTSEKAAPLPMDLPPPDQVAAPPPPAPAPPPAPPPKPRATRKPSQPKAVSQAQEAPPGANTVTHDPASSSVELTSPASRIVPGGGAVLGTLSVQAQRVLVFGPASRVTTLGVGQGSRVEPFVGPRPPRSGGGAGFVDDIRRSYGGGPAIDPSRGPFTMGFLGTNRGFVIPGGPPPVPGSSRPVPMWDQGPLGKGWLDTPGSTRAIGERVRLTRELAINEREVAKAVRDNPQWAERLTSAGGVMTGIGMRLGGIGGGALAAGLGASDMASENFRNSLTLLRNEIGMSFIPMIVRLSNYAQDGAHWFRGLDSSTKSWIGTLGAGALAGGALLTVGGQLMGVLGGLARVGGMLGIGGGAAAGASAAAAGGGAAGLGAGGVGAGVAAGGIAARFGGLARLGGLARFAGNAATIYGGYHAVREGLSEDQRIQAEGGAPDWAIMANRALGGVGGLAYNFAARPLINRATGWNLPSIYSSVIGGIGNAVGMGSDFTEGRISRAEERKEVRPEGDEERRRRAMLTSWNPQYMQGAAEFRESLITQSLSMPSALLQQAIEGNQIFMEEHARTNGQIYDQSAPAAGLRTQDVNERMGELATEIAGLKQVMQRAFLNDVPPPPGKF